MTLEAISVLQEEVPIINEEIQKEYLDLKDICEKSAYGLKHLSFLYSKLNLETSSLSNLSNLILEPIKCIMYVQVQEFIENSYRLVFGIHEESTPFILSRYFDKIHVLVAGNHYSWERNVDSMNTDSIEIVLPKNIPDILEISITLFPDLPLSFYSVPDSLIDLVHCQYACFSQVFRSISQYCYERNLIRDKILNCDGYLAEFFGESEVPAESLVFHIRSKLLPIHPITINSNLNQKKRIQNFEIILPGFSKFPLIEGETISSELQYHISGFAEKREVAGLITSYANNPIETLEAEICGHSAACELYDESNDNGPTVSISDANLARRSSMYYWQPWTSEHASRFLEENKIIHSRYPSKK